MDNEDAVRVSEIKALKASALVDYLDSLGSIKCEICGRDDFGIDTVPENLEVPIIIELPINQLPTSGYMCFSVYCKTCGNSKLLRADVISRRMEQQAK